MEETYLLWLGIFSAGFLKKRNQYYFKHMSTHYVISLDDHVSLLHFDGCSWSSGCGLLEYTVEIRIFYKFHRITEVRLLNLPFVRVFIFIYAILANNTRVSVIEYVLQMSVLY